MSNREQISFLKRLAKALAVQFGPQCEVVVHDLARGNKQSIIAIENGHVTGRQIGEGISEEVLQALRDGEDAESYLSRTNRTQDGRLLKSFTTCIRDETGTIIAVLCVNHDITSISHATTLLAQFVGDSRDRSPNDNPDSLPCNVNTLLDQLIEESVGHVGKPVALMTKEDKIKAIRYLAERGAFLIKKSGDKIARYYDISKYTLYNYMDSN